MKRGLPAALLLSAICTVAAFGPAVWDPSAYLVGNPEHPDCLGNHWLADWVAHRLRAGHGILHNPDYYWPVGDAPVLAGNGADGILAAPLLYWLGWPGGLTLYSMIQRFADGLAGFALARAAGARPSSSLLAIPASALSSYVLIEASSGRLSQAGTWPLIGFLAAFLWMWDRPRMGRALLAGLLFAICGFLYWYHAWFGVLGALVLSLGRGGVWGTNRLRAMMILGITAGTLLLPWAGMWIQGWSNVPGISETFPPKMTEMERLLGPLDLLRGRPGPTRAAILNGALLLPLGLWLYRPWARSKGAIGTLILLIGLGIALGAGNFGEHSPYVQLYGLTGILRRFWWPIRHFVWVHPAVAALAALAIDRLRIRAWFHKGAILLVIIGFVPMARWQGAASGVELTPIEWPPEVYGRLREAAPGVLLMPPLTPEASGSQWPLLYQRAHGHPLLTGHAPWVARVRPVAWDRFMAEHPLLSELQALERGERSSGVQIQGSALRDLVDQGIRWAALDRGVFVMEQKPLIDAYQRMFRELCGPATLWSRGVQIWDLEQCSPEKEVRVGFSWPPSLKPGGPERPVTGTRPSR